MADDHIADDHKAPEDVSGEVMPDEGEDLVKRDPLLASRGTGKHLWRDEHADEYVRRLREGR